MNVRDDCRRDLATSHATPSAPVTRNGRSGGQDRQAAPVDAGDGNRAHAALAAHNSIRVAGRIGRCEARRRYAEAA